MTTQLWHGTLRSAWPPGPATLTLQVKRQAANHPHAGHQQRIQKDKGQYDFASEHDGKADRKGNHDSQDAPGEKAVFHGVGNQEVDMWGRMTSSAGWFCRKSSG